MATAGAVNVVISTSSGMTLGAGGGSVLEGSYYGGSYDHSILAPSECKGVDEMEIGGNTCHLCGAKIVEKDSYGHLGKRGAWKTATYVRYQCGMTVEISAKGKKSVVIGDDCIQI
jgi:hypothetical protein